MSEIISLDSGEYFELNTNYLTAKVIKSHFTGRNVIIHKSIIHQSQHFLITNIEANSFEGNKFVESIDFPDDSSLFSIEKNAFKSSNLRRLYIPPSISNLQEGWCNNTPRLTQVVISPNNRNFKYIDEKHEMIARKSDKNSEVYDVLIFASRNIRYAVIPKWIKYIESYCFCDCEKLESIEISEDSELLSIGKNSFTNTSIKRLFIPPKVQELREGWCNKIPYLNQVEISPNNRHFKCFGEKNEMIAGKSDKNSEVYDTLIFVSRNISQVIVPKWIKCIESNSFDNCQMLQIVDIPEDSELQLIKRKAFSNCPISELYLPSGLVEIQDNWIDSCYKLKKITMSTNNQNFSYLDDKKEIIVGKSDTNIDNYDVIIFANREITKAIIPSSIRIIYSFAFYKCANLKIIKFDENSEICSIGKKSFSSTSINEVMIPEKVEMIGKYAFEQNSKLYKVIIKENSQLKSFPEGLFYYCNKLSNIEFPHKCELRCIGKHSLSYTCIEKFYIPSNVVELKEGWCRNTDSLNQIVISTENHKYKYADNNKSMIVEASDLNNENFDILVFANRNIKKALIPENVKHIKSSAFEDCVNLKNVILSNNSDLRTIGKYAFYKTQIKRIFIPPKVEELLKCCFSDIKCLNRIDISSENQNFKVENQILFGKSDLKSDIFDVIYFAYKNIQKAFVSSSIKFILPYAFYDDENLKSIEIQKNSELQSIGAFAFSSTSITHFTIPKNVETIGKDAFSSCMYLKEFKFEDGMKLYSLPNSLFSFCPFLRKIEIPDDSQLHTVNESTFNFSSIDEFYISQYLVDIKEGWLKYSKINRISFSPQNKNFKYFDDTKQIIIHKSDKNFDVLFFVAIEIEKIYIPKFIKSISSSCFKACKKIKYIEFSDDSELESIGGYAFEDSLIQNITIPKNVSSIGFQAFKNCLKLKSIEFLEEIFLNDVTIIDKCENLQLISFPNAKKISMKKIIFTNDFSLFVCTNAKLYFN